MASVLRGKARENAAGVSCQWDGCRLRMFSTGRDLYSWLDDSGFDLVDILDLRIL